MKTEYRPYVLVRNKYLLINVKLVGGCVVNFERSTKDRDEISKLIGKVI